jgi:hypothetical protein
VCEGLQQRKRDKKDDNSIPMEKNTVFALSADIMEKGP